MKQLNKLLKRCAETKNVTTKIVGLDPKTLAMKLFTDSSFANAEKNKSQLGFVLILQDNSGKGNILHYGSSR